MDEKILELLQEMQSRFDSIDNQLIDLKEGQEEIKNKLDLTYNQVARNMEGITEASEKIDSLKSDINFVEIATSKNWNEIAKLKAIK
ncbi:MULTISPECIES: hypothetical protein [Clostridioides]|uniref:hypothetical protein n=2 Tax=Clostridioides TaxID=1870884 RepID=UPI001CA5CD03|nr:hypothetical protein [Clostridioides sp. ES-S-0049-03]MCC0678417.1 hypothetical protein [Clostridioides sp. ES-W-0018-02]MCC0707258.1 hypothetical protein [Clostridioides sp. ES-S-0190-01]MCC0713244.1 hypothetical protein [Clostridioides sp. ES-W-0017-02]